MARHPSFRAADVHTGFIPQHFDSLFPELKITSTQLTQAAVALVLNELTASTKNAEHSSRNPFVIENGLRLNHLGIRRYQFKFNNIGKYISISHHFFIIPIIHA